MPYERTPQENFSSDLLDSAVSFYANNLKSDEASHVKDYLKARGITGAVAKKFNLAVELVDERLSSFEAKEFAKDDSLDAMAAKLILDSWMNNNEHS